MDVLARLDILEKIKNNLERVERYGALETPPADSTNRVELAYSDMAQVKNDFKSILVYTPTEFGESEVVYGDHRYETRSDRMSHAFWLGCPRRSVQ